MKNKNIFTPLYLDVETMLDILATLDDGFRKGSKVSSNSSYLNSSENLKEGKVGVGVPFITISGGGSKNTGTSDSQNESEEYEKYHTYGSLMNILIDRLRENNILEENNTSFDNLNEYDFALLNGNFKQNVFTEYLKKVNNIIKIMQSLPKSFPDSHNKDEGTGEIMDFVKKSIEDIENKNYQKYLLEIPNSNFKASMILFDDYIRDRSGIELSLGNYNILCKIVQKIDSDEKINFWTDDILDNIRLKLLDEFIKGLNHSLDGNDEVKEMLDLPNMNSLEIKGNIMRIIPIAIFI